MSNSFGDRFRVSIFGQSHGPSIGALIDGVPAGIALDMETIAAFMARRAPGGALATARREADAVNIIAGLNARGETCGAPICAMIDNLDVRSGDYDAMQDVPRPGHADYTAFAKYGEARDMRGGGQFSGRLTAPLCFAGAVAQQIPAMRGVRVFARIAEIAGETASEAWEEKILVAKAAGDSVGGIIELSATGIPAGLGEPMFGGVENRLSQALFAIPGVRGVEFGLGFEAAKMRGSEHNDAFYAEDGKVRTRTNNHGGVLGGITSGMPIVLRVAIKPTSSIAMEQESVSLKTFEAQAISVKGRHDPCIVPRAVPCVEAAALIVLADMML